MTFCGFAIRANFLRGNLKVGMVQS